MKRKQDQKKRNDESRGGEKAVRIAGTVVETIVAAVAELRINQRAAVAERSSLDVVTLTAASAARGWLSWQDQEAEKRQVKRKVATVDQRELPPQGETGSKY